MPTKKTPLSVHDSELLQAISDVVTQNDGDVRLPMSALNQDIATLVAQNAAVMARVSNVLTRKLTQAVTDNDNDLEVIGTVLLTGINGWIQENDLLLNHLASSAGLINPGDPLEAALLDQVAEAPELAYSATLLIALRESMPYLASIALSLERIAGAQGASPAETQADEDDAEETAIDTSITPGVIDDWPPESLS